MSDFAEVHVCVPEAASAAVAGFLLDEVGAGFEQRDADTLAAPDPGLVEFVMWVPSSSVQTRMQSVNRFVDALREMGTTVDPFTWRQAPLDPEDWEDVYKRHFKTLRIARRFVIKPSWEQYETERGDLLVELDPGMAFGTGLHPSTRLVLSTIERTLRSSLQAPQAILDLGCGSGILAIAAARAWPRSRVVAVDMDEAAVQTCQQNTQRNDLATRIQVQQHNASEMSGTFDLVLANINHELLAQQHETLMGLLTRNARLVLSGLLVEQAPELARLYTRELRLEPEYTEDEDGWRVLLLRTLPRP